MENKFVPNYIKAHAINARNIDEPLRSEWFDRYFKTHVNGFELAEQVEQGEIKNLGIWYKINWLDLPSACYAADQVVLSFRRICGFKYGYVLISVNQIGD